MMSAAREEAAILSTELAASARTAAIESGGAAAIERQAVMDVMNPVAVRQAAESSVREVAGETSLLAEHLSHIRAPTTTIQTTTTTTTSTITTTTGTTLTSSSKTIVTKALEEDLGVTLKEVMSNATQTGLEEQMDQVVDMAKTLAQGNAGPNLAMLAQRA
nr:uncharacterized protein CI109_007197 [Kwoniella shandongensis]KAA5524490.1 hypothetical protein CI109_007197 [Kwoniella shandongensis]